MSSKSRTTDLPAASRTTDLSAAPWDDPGPPAHDQYEVFTPPVGAGEMGVVYRGRHRELDKLFALKVTRPGAAVERVRREARLLARVSSPHVVAVHGFEPLADGRHLLVMDWVDGPDLGRVLAAAGGPLPESRAVGWMRHVADGMRAAADEGITHRDLKPSNILVDGRDLARVADFGLARGPAVGPDLTAHAGPLGTAYYMAPEQAEAPTAADTRADVYGFGATFYHLLTGTPPFDAETVFGVLFKHKVEPLAAPRSRNPALSDRTAEVIERCLAKNPADRFQSFEDLARHLDPRADAAPWDRDGPDPHHRRYRERRDLYLDPARRPALAADPDVYPFGDGRVLTVTAGDITKQPRVDAVVSPDNELLSMSAGVARAVRTAAGSDRLRAEVRKYPPVRAGRVVVTSAGDLPARFVFHAVTAAALNARVAPSRDLLTEILNGCVHLADTLSVTSLALPLLGTGGGSFSADVCLDTLFRFWSRTLSRGATSVRDVRVVLHVRPPRRRPAATRTSTSTRPRPTGR